VAVTRSGPINKKLAQRLMSGELGFGFWWSLAASRRGAAFGVPGRQPRKSAAL